jgi:hypothetical protein
MAALRPHDAISFAQEGLDFVYNSELTLLLVRAIPALASGFVVSWVTTLSLSWNLANLSNRVHAAGVSPVVSIAAPPNGCAASWRGRPSPLNVAVACDDIG